MIRLRHPVYFEVNQKAMLRIFKLTDEQIRETIIHGEFSNDIICSNAKTAIIMSQSWCPQWMMVNHWLKTIPENFDIHIYTSIYDKEKYYHEFMHFKETVFKNHEVPYIRYYINGNLVKETNYTSKDFFMNVFM